MRSFFFCIWPLTDSRLHTLHTLYRHVVFERPWGGEVCQCMKLDMYLKNSKQRNSSFWTSGASKDETWWYGNLELDTTSSRKGLKPPLSPTLPVSYTYRPTSHPAVSLTSGLCVFGSSNTLNPHESNSMFVFSASLLPFTSLLMPLLSFISPPSSGVFRCCCLLPRRRTPPLLQGFLLFVCHGNTFQIAGCH